VRDFGGDGGDFCPGGGEQRVGIDILAQTVSSVSNAACKQTTRFLRNCIAYVLFYQIISFFLHRELRIRFCILLKKASGLFRILC